MKDAKSDDEVVFGETPPLSAEDLAKLLPGVEDEDFTVRRARERYEMELRDAHYEMELRDARQAYSQRVRRLLLGRPRLVFDVRISAGGVFGWLLTKVDAPARAEVPPAAEKLLCLLYPPERLDEILGDYEELFHRMCDKHGVGFGKCWYFWQVLCAGVHRVASGVNWCATVAGKIFGSGD